MPAFREFPANATVMDYDGIELNANFTSPDYGDDSKLGVSILYIGFRGPLHCYGAGYFKRWAGKYVQISIGS